MNISALGGVSLGDDAWIKLLIGGELDRMPSLGFLLEFTLILAVAATVPRFVPTLMGRIWPETAII